MALAIVGTPVRGDFGTFESNTKTISVTVPSGAELLVMKVAGGNGGGNWGAFTSLTVNGSATGVTSQVQSLADMSIKTRIWTLVNPTVGTYDVVWTFSGSSENGGAYFAECWGGGVDTGSPVDDTDSHGDSADTSPSTNTLTVSTGGAVTAVHALTAGTIGVEAGQTAVGTLDTRGSSYKVASGSVSVGFNWSGTPQAAQSVIAIKAVAGAPVLSGPSALATANTTASGTVSTTGADGSVYAVRSSAQPTNAQIVAGQDSTGAASSAGSLAVTTSGSKTIPLIGVDVPTGSQTVWFLHRPAAGAGSDSNVTSATWTQPTAPVLSSPTNTPGSTTALIGATTTVSSGTAYFLARVGGSAASAATIITTGQTSPVTTTTPSRTVTGLTASTANNFVDIVQVSGVTTSNVVSTAAFTTTASGDTTVPVLTGSIVIGTVTSTSIQFSWSAGSDNVGVTSYEVSSNGGSGYVDAGLVLTYTFTGLTASTSYGLRVRAKDAAGNVSTPALAATQSTAAASGVGAINLNNAALYTFKTNNGTSLSSLPVTFYVHDVSTGVLIGSAITGLSTNASALVTTAVSNASMLAGTTYALRWKFSSGEYGVAELPAV
jgi:hypothetical protein